MQPELLNMVHIIAQQHRHIVLLSLVLVGLPLTWSIRVPLALEGSAADSEVVRADAAHGESTLESDIVGDTEGDNATEYMLGVQCQKQITKFTKITIDAACPAIEPRMEPSMAEDTLQFLHFKCDRYAPMRRCYEAIPNGVGINPLLMPSAKNDWRKFSRLFWPSQGLLNWHGMNKRVPGAIGPVVASHGWEWLAHRHGGNCYNCWSSFGEREKSAEIDNWYLRKYLGAVPWSDIRVMLDIGGGAGNIAAVLNRDHNITVVSDNGDFGAPFLETIAARGLLSLSFNMERRLPFADGAFDAVHSRTTGLGDDIEAFLVENDRLVRPGGYIIMHSQCARNTEGLRKLQRTAARLLLQDNNTFRVSSSAQCDKLVSAVWRKPKARSSAQMVTRRVAAGRARHCDSLECLCKHRFGAWKLEGDTVGTCSHDLEALWHWISQHCVQLDVGITKASRCAAATKELPAASARRASQHCTLFTAVTQLNLPLSTDALRTVLDIEGDGRLVSELQSAYGIQGMVLSSDLHNLKVIASRGVVGLQSSLNMRQPFENGAFDMIHVPAALLEKSFRAQRRSHNETQQESFRRSIDGDLSTPAPIPNLYELIYEMDRLVRPGGFVVISFDPQTPSAPGILHTAVRKLGWKRRTRKGKQGLVFVRPSKRSEQHA